MRFRFFKKGTAAVLTAVLCCYIFTCAAFAPSAGAVTQQELDDLRAAQAMLEEQKSGIKEVINSLEYDQMTVTSKKEVLDEQMVLTQSEIENITAQIKAYDRLIDEKKAEVAAAQEKEDAQWELYKVRVRAMEENGVESFISMLLDTSSIADLLGRLDVIMNIMKSDQEVYQELEDARLETQEAQTALENVQAEQLVEQVKLENKRAELEEEIKEAGELMSQIADDIAEQEQIYNALQESQDQIDRMLRAKIAEFEAEQARLKAEAEEKARQKAEAEEKARQEAEAAKQAEQADELQEQEEPSDTEQEETEDPGETEAPDEPEEPSDTEDAGDTSQEEETSTDEETSDEEETSDTSDEEDGDDEEEESGSSGTTGSFIWPSNNSRYITDYYGWRDVHPVYGTSRMHNGIDIGAAYGTDVLAADGGTVILVSYDSGGYGNYVMINHGNGTSTLYAHMSSVYVYTGQTVSQGQTIGLVGATGGVTGPHLHFEIWIGSSRVDPLNYF